MKFLGEYRFKSPRFVLIVQHDYGNHAQRLLAGVALGHLSLQVL